MGAVAVDDLQLVCEIGIRLLMLVNEQLGIPDDRG